MTLQDSYPIEGDKLKNIAICTFLRTDSYSVTAASMEERRAARSLLNTCWIHAGAPLPLEVDVKNAIIFFHSILRLWWSDDFRPLFRIWNWYVQEGTSWLLVPPPESSPAYLFFHCRD